MGHETHLLTCVLLTWGVDELETFFEGVFIRLSWVPSSCQPQLHIPSVMAGASSTRGASWRRLECSKASEAEWHLGKVRNKKQIDLMP